MSFYELLVNMAANGKTGNIRKNEDTFSNATIEKWIEKNPGLALIRIQHDNGPVPEFEPGQFITIGLPRNYPPINNPEKYPENDPRWQKLWRRAYSIASSPKNCDHVDLLINVVDDGDFTPKLWHIEEQGRLWMDTKIKGDFTLEQVPKNKDLVMVATGTGIAPFVSMLDTYRNTQRWRRFIIIHGCRLQEDLGYELELEYIAQNDESVIYIPTLTREPEQSTWRGLRGRVPMILDPINYKKLVGSELDPSQCHAFLCGNPEMINQVEELLQQKGFTTHSRKQPGNIHFERYW